MSPASGDEPALSQAEVEDIQGPIVAQVTDPATGELEVLFGESEVLITDPELVAKLLRATQT